MPLQEMTVADIGSGTGSSVASLARHAKRAVGYEINPDAAEVAKDRLRILGISNAEIRVVSPEETVDRIREDFPDGVKVLTLIAVLEHMTPTERIAFLSDVWSALAPGGGLVVYETPNRLTYWDYHSSWLPFFHMLPVEIMNRYASRSARAGFKDLPFITMSPESIFRWGFGISFHEFEIAIPEYPIDDILVADGYESEPMSCWPVTDEERLLAQYFVSKPIEKPLGFSRDVLNIILRKPWPSVQCFNRAHSPEWIEWAFEYYKMPEGAAARVLGKW